MVVSVAIAEFPNPTVAKGPPLSKNVTDPVGVGPPAQSAETLAVNVTPWPGDEGFTEDERLIFVTSVRT